MRVMLSIVYCVVVPRGQAPTTAKRIRGKGGYNIGSTVNGFLLPQE